MKNCPETFIMKRLNVDFMLTPEVMLLEFKSQKLDMPLKSY